MRNFSETLRRFFVFLVGLAVMALAVSVLSKASLGISPIQSICYVIYRRFQEQITLGTLVFCWNCTLVLLQWPFRGFRWIDLIQIPLSLFFGGMVDVCGGLLDTLGFQPQGMVLRILAMLFGLLILALSISITVAAGTIMNPGESFVFAVSQRTKQPFGRIKVIVDVSIITLAVIASFVLFGEWRFDIIGLGTVVCATTTGFIVHFDNRFVRPIVDRICIKKQKGEKEV